jgi:hypothetical protein
MFREGKMFYTIHTRVTCAQTFTEATLFLETKKKCTLAHDLLRKYILAQQIVMTVS